MARNRSTEIWASVITNPSVVAICGWIMPEPLVMPATRTMPRRSLAWANAVFGARSVVMIARAASSNRSPLNPLARCGRASMIFLASSSTPITPVEAGRTCATGSLSSRAAAFDVANARGAVGVAGIHQHRAHQAARKLQMAAAQFHRRGLYPVLCEDGGGVGRESGHDQSQIVLFHLADAGVGGGVCVSQRQIHLGDSPNLSFSVNRCPFAKSAAEIRLRPSSCTSSNSSVELPHWTTSGFRLTKQPGAGKSADTAGRIACATDLHTCNVCPRNLVYAPGQGCKPRTRL